MRVYLVSFIKRLVYSLGFSALVFVASGSVPDLKPAELKPVVSQKKEIQPITKTYQKPLRCEAPSFTLNKPLQ